MKEVNSEEIFLVSATKFVRKKINHSDTISVVVVSKTHGKFTEMKKFGVSRSGEEVDELFQKAKLWHHTHDGQQELDFNTLRYRALEETTQMVERD